MQGTYLPRYALRSAGLLTVFVSLLSATASSPSNCSASDASLLRWRQALCRSIDGPGAGCGVTPGNASVGQDWPSQATYAQHLLAEVIVAGEAHCLHTPLARSTVRWINVNQSQPKGGGIMDMWVGQSPYFDTPRAPGERIESATTLGRKCWGFAYMRQVESQTGGLIKRTRVELITSSS